MLIWVGWLPGSALTPLCGVPSTENVKKKSLMESTVEHCKFVLCEPKVCV